MVAALAGVDLDVRAGDSVALLGPNGAGKTTLLRMLATLLRPTSGILKLFGDVIESGNTIVRKRIGLLSHQTFLYPDLTVAQNLDFYGRLYGVEDRAQRIPELIERTGLTGFANRPVRTLSRGLEQRCGIARALLHRPELLLLDEPFTGLDRGAGAILSALVRQFRERGGAVVMVTHDLDRALELCGRLVLLQSGKLYWQGDNDERSRPEFDRACDAVLAKTTD